MKVTCLSGARGEMRPINRRRRTRNTRRLKNVAAHEARSTSAGGNRRTIFEMDQQPIIARGFSAADTMTIH